MFDLYIIAEAAQGYLPLEGDTGSVDTALLLVKAAAIAKADAVKFQIVYVAELAQPGNIHYDIFRRLEMDEAAWRRIREYARSQGVDFLVDVFGERSLEVARRLAVDGIKVHSTSFFDHDLVGNTLLAGCPVYFSIGGIERSELDVFVARHRLRERKDVALLYGFQAEPTPLDENQLARIPVIAAHTGLRVGFMDHADGSGPDDIHLSVLALGLGVRIFEKHVTLDRELALEDFVSGISPRRLTDYVSALRRVAPALGTPDLGLTDAERVYREKALKRATAARALRAGTCLAPEDIKLVRTAEAHGVTDIDAIVGKHLRLDVPQGHALSLEDFE